MSTRTIGSIVLAGMVLAVAGCGSTAPAATGTPATATPTAVESTPSAPPVPSPSLGAIVGPGEAWIASQERGLVRLVRPDGSGDHAVFPMIPGGEQLHPDWSPDGMRLSLTTRGETDEIWVGNADGSNPQKVVECQAPCAWADEAAWSPDGTKLIFQRMVSDGGVGVSTLETHDVTSGATRTVAAAPAGRAFFQPRWSPDGTRLVTEYVVFAGTPPEIDVTGVALAIVDLSADVPTITEITDAADLTNSPDWSWATDRIVFAQPNTPAGFDGSSDLVTMRPDGSDRMTVLSVDPRDGQTPQPAWSTDGTRIIFVQPDSSMATIGADGSDPAPAIEVGPGRGLHPRYRPATSPAADQPTLDSDEAEVGGGGWITVLARGSAIQVMSPDGTDQRSPWTRTSISFCPNLSPDGSEVAYSVQFGGLFFEPLGERTGRRHIGRFSQFGFMDGVWSPDRSHLAFRAQFEGTVQRFQVVSMTDDSVRTLLTTTTEELIGEAAWSPDSHRLALTRAHDGQATIDIVDLAGTVHDSIGPIAAVDWISLAWSPDGSSLAYQAGAPAGSNPLTVVELSTGQTHELASGPIGPMSPSVSPWSPDGRWLAIADAGGDLLVVSRDGTERTTVPMPENDGMRIQWSPVADLVAIGLDDALLTVAPGATEANQRAAVLSPGRGISTGRPDGSRFVFAGVDKSTGDLAVVTQSAHAAGPFSTVASFPPLGNDVPADGTPPPCISWDPARAPG